MLDLARLGFTVDGFDTSVHARRLAGRIHRSCASNARITDTLGRRDEGAYDLVMAFEVLEHVEDDAAAVKRWTALLKPGGRLVVSVPAHTRLWGPSDEWAGHYRRYERSDLERLLAGAGLEVSRTISYGFPVSNVLQPISNAAGLWKMRQRRGLPDGLGKAAATAKSGTDRRLEQLFFPLVASSPIRMMFRAAFHIQRRFYEADAGTGYIAIAALP